MTTHVQCNRYTDIAVKTGVTTCTDLKGGQNDIKGELAAQTMISSWKWSLTSDPLQRTYSKQLPASSFNSQSIEQEVKGIASICDHPSNSKCHST